MILLERLTVISRIDRPLRILLHQCVFVIARPLGNRGGGGGGGGGWRGCTDEKGENLKEGALKTVSSQRVLVLEERPVTGSWSCGVF